MLIGWFDHVIFQDARHVDKTKSVRVMRVGFELKYLFIFSDRFSQCIFNLINCKDA